MKINLLQRFFDGRFWALVLKEIRQILKNRQSIFLLIFPPTIQLLVFGLALSPNVDHLSLGLVDYANSGQSREFVSALVENDIFQIAATPKNEAQLQQQVRNGQLIAGLIIPPDFDRDLNRGNSTFVQVFIDGVDANTAGITRGYLQQIINAYNRQQNPQFSTLPIETQSRFFI